MSNPSSTKCSICGKRALYRNGEGISVCDSHKIMATHKPKTFETRLNSKTTISVRSLRKSEQCQKRLHYKCLYEEECPCLCHKERKTWGF